MANWHNKVLGVSDNSYTGLPADNSAISRNSPRVGLYPGIARGWGYSFKPTATV